MDAIASDDSALANSRMKERHANEWTVILPPIETEPALPGQHLPILSFLKNLPQDPAAGSLLYPVRRVDCTARR